jgi:hypothetical protein
MFILTLVSMLAAHGQSIEASHPQYGNPARLTSMPAANPALGVAHGQNELAFRQSWFSLGGLQNSWTVVGDFDGDGLYRNDDGLYEVGEVTGSRAMTRSSFSIVIAPRDYLKFVQSDKWRRWLDNRFAFHLSMDFASAKGTGITPGWVPKYTALDGSYFPTIEGGLSFELGPRLMFIGVGVFLGEIGVDAKINAVARANVAAFPSDEDDPTVSLGAAGEIREVVLGVAPKLGFRLGTVLDLGPLMDLHQEVPRYGLRFGFVWQGETTASVGGSLTGALSVDAELDGEVVADDTLLSGDLFTLDPQQLVLSPAMMNLGLEAYVHGVEFGGWAQWVQWTRMPASTGISFNVAGTSDALDYDLSLGQQYGESGFKNAWSGGGHVRYSRTLTKVPGRVKELVLAPELGVSFMQDYVPDQSGISNLLNGPRTAVNLCGMAALKGLGGTHSGMQFDACVEGTFMQRKGVLKDGGSAVDDAGVAILPPGTPFPDKTIQSGGQYWVLTVGARWTFGKPRTVLTGADPVVPEPVEPLVDNIDERVLETGDDLVDEVYPEDEDVSDEVVPTDEPVVDDVVDEVVDDVEDDLTRDGAEPTGDATPVDPAPTDGQAPVDEGPSAEDDETPATPQ